MTGNGERVTFFKKRSHNEEVHSNEKRNHFFGAPGFDPEPSLPGG
jgi:hypothetical protein